jgi:hypothetical protein
MEPECCQRRGILKALAPCKPGLSSEWTCAAKVRALTTAQHGTSAGWHSGCRCTLCRRVHSDTQRASGRARARKRLPAEMRQQLVDAIYSGRAFRSVLRDLNLTPNQVWGMARVDRESSTALEAALTATRRDDLKHGTNDRPVFVFEVYCFHLAHLVLVSTIGVVDGRHFVFKTKSAHKSEKDQDARCRLPSRQYLQRAIVQRCRKKVN